MIILVIPVSSLDTTGIAFLNTRLPGVDLDYQLIATSADEM